MKKFSVLRGAIIAFVLIVFTAQTSNANPVSNQNTAERVEMGTEILNSIVFLNIVDGKCGEGTAKTEKKTEAKTKTAEGKCGEGKCGEGTAKTEKKTEAKTKSSETKTTSEGKCGEGSSKTEKSTSKKAKTSEGKCGEGKCGVA